MISSGYRPAAAKVATQPDDLHGNSPKEIPKEALSKGHSHTPKVISSPLMLSSVSHLSLFADSHRAWGETHRG